MNPKKHSVLTAILVDGGFYRRRARYYNGFLSPKQRAKELNEYCYDLLSQSKYEQRNLYRIFYYDCPPSEKVVYNPITKKSVRLDKSEEYSWMGEFLKELKHYRKFALRLGRLSETELYYNLKPEAVKKLLNGNITVEQLTESDVALNIVQKGVDMRIGIDISSLAYKKQVNQIILISGDSDFVPAAKQARREGIDFLLNPMGNPIKDDLFEHIDGLISRAPKSIHTQTEKCESDE